MNDAAGRMKDEMTSSRSSFAFIFHASLLAIFSLLIAANARAQLTGPEQYDETELAGGNVIAVNFEGNHQLSSDELATVTATNFTGWFSRTLYNSWILRSFGGQYQTLELATLQRDTQSLNHYYWDRGYLDARSSYRVSHNIDDERAYYKYIRNQRLTKSSSGTAEIPEIRDTATFIISEGQPYTISRVAIEGFELLPNQFQTVLMGNMTIKTSEKWSRATAAKEVQRLTTI